MWILILIRKDMSKTRALEADRLQKQSGMLLGNIFEDYMEAQDKIQRKF